MDWFLLYIVVCSFGKCHRQNLLSEGSPGLSENFYSHNQLTTKLFSLLIKAFCQRIPSSNSCIRVLQRKRTSRMCVRVYVCMFLFLSIYQLSQRSPAGKNSFLVEVGQSVLFRTSTNWMRSPTLSTLFKVQFKWESHPKQYLQTH